MYWVYIVIAYYVYDSTDGLKECVIMTITN